ncbi:MAG: leucine--tRNA ligase [Alphaproteobacteria bacterium]|nr:leucine--tRNA ligase [Alphaproteobacteria bacterium]
MADDIKKIIERESKWQKRWREAKAFVPKNDGKKQRFYNLVEFPFLSGSGLHAGHLLIYTGMDVMSRFRRHQGYDVLFPMGFDAMGITAEHYATKIGRHPAEIAEELKKSYSEVIDQAGWSVDPETRVATSDPEYVKWTQWMFIQFFKNGLAYKSELPMNWCPNCKTTLTNEELEDGKCNRCHGDVEKKLKLQWNLRLGDYAEKLLAGLEDVDFDDRVKKDEINLIGKSTGAEVDFKVGDDVMTVYTTRVDTIFGVTFCVLAPEHKLVRKWLNEGKISNKDDVEKYIKESAAKSEIERTDATKEKTGVELKGIKALNPFNNTEIPLFISDYVLADYGFGAIMAVPAHDGRDYAFAKKFDLPIIQVLAGGDISQEAWEQDGEHINSSFLDGMGKEDAITAAIKYGTEHGFARAATQYKLKDWGFSRQMYWGEPIPLVHCEKCRWQPVPEDALPVIQPYMTDYKPTDDGESPLARATDWVNTTCPVCGGAAKRETDTMPGWAGSSWYYLRYLDAHNDKEFCSKEQMEKWMPVTHYNGGHEHNTRHLIYSRFWHHALYDLGLVNTPEPYHKRTAQGLVLGSDGYKMSKSRGNGFQVTDLLNSAGADAARVAILSLGPWKNNTIWTEGTLAGVQRFLKRVESFSDNLTDEPLTANQERLVNKLIADNTERLENMGFNTAISAMMEFINEFPGGKMPRKAYEILIQLLNPFAPHLTEEMWEKLGHKDMLVFEPWPTFDASKLVENEMTIVVSVNGKRANDFVVPVDISESDLIETAKQNATKQLDGATIIKTIVVPKKLVNFVVKK